MLTKVNAKGDHCVRGCGLQAQVGLCISLSKSIKQKGYTAAAGKPCSAQRIAKRHPGENHKPKVFRGEKRPGREVKGE